MGFPSTRTSLFLGLCSLSLAAGLSEGPKEPRLSIFNIIKFQNSACTGSGTRNGTCFTEAECENAGGVKSGSCADGFGVCCVKTIAIGGATSVNESYIVHTTAQTINIGANTYTVCPSSVDVCRIRFDFTIFNLAPPFFLAAPGAAAGGFTGGAIGDCVRDTFVITSSGGSATPVICGVNTGQHMIVDNDGGGCSCVNVGIFDATFTTRAFDIKVTQYRCGEEAGGPGGCLQYFEQAQNNIRSFNFPVTARGANFADTVVHLSSQEYTVCIRRAAGMRQICYIACTSQAAAPVTMTASSFGLSLATITAINSAVGSMCTSDYITIPNGQAIVAAAGANVIVGNQRFCGRLLQTASAIVDGGGNTVSVCSTSVPFRLGVHTDEDEFEANHAMLNNAESFGFPGGILGFNICYLQN